MPTRATFTTLVICCVAASAPARGQEAPEQPATRPATQPATQPAAPAEPRTYELTELMKLARRRYAGVEAARHAVDAMQAKLYQAKWAWIPQGTVKGLVAPAPEIDCRDVDADGNVIPGGERCIETSAVDVNQFNVAGVFTRINVEVGMPVYTFDKLGAAKRAAFAGVEIKQAQLARAEDKVVRDVARAYWGLKLARDILYYIDEGEKYLEKGLARVERELDTGEGDATMTDLYRLQAAQAEVETRTAEAKKLERLSRAALATLTGLEMQDFEIPRGALEPLDGSLGAVGHYLDEAQRHRPELKAVRAAVDARRAAVDLEKARFYPDFLIVAMAGAGYASSVDDPENAFFNDPFNFTSAGIGLALNWKWDQVQQYGKYKAARAQAAETAALQREARAGIKLEVRKAVVELQEARERLEATRKGMKASRRWLVATAQNMEAGLAEPKDLTDALVGYFTLQMRHLEAIFDLNMAWHELDRVTGQASESFHKR